MLVVHIINIYKTISKLWQNLHVFLSLVGHWKKQKGLRVFTFLHEYANQHYNNKLQIYHDPFEAFKITAGIDTNKHKQ